MMGQASSANRRRPMVDHPFPSEERREPISTSKQDTRVFLAANDYGWKSLSDRNSGVDSKTSKKSDKYDASSEKKSSDDKTTGAENIPTNTKKSNSGCSCECTGYPRYGHGCCGCYRPLHCGYPCHHYHH